MRERTRRGTAVTLPLLWKRRAFWPSSIRFSHSHRGKRSCKRPAPCHISPRKRINGLNHPPKSAMSTKRRLPLMMMTVRSRSHSIVAEIEPVGQKSVA